MSARWCSSTGPRTRTKMVLGSTLTCTLPPFYGYTIRYHLRQLGGCYHPQLYGGRHAHARDTLVQRCQPCRDLSYHRWVSPESSNSNLSLNPSSCFSASTTFSLPMNHVEYQIINSCSLQLFPCRYIQRWNGTTNIQHPSRRHRRLYVHREER
jgi:hypothetical protein